MKCKHNNLEITTEYVKCLDCDEEIISEGTGGKRTEHEVYWDGKKWVEEKHK